ncbi:MAG TPA: LytTR family DNA-binding domain-containing protein [Vicinamibacterales bacterium]|nr:LytTR family DNA-binding domain-containing protein [Vicinamibacterales bacterium]
MPVASKIRTLVVDDEPVARARLLSLLRDEPDIEVIGQCESGPGAIAAIENTSPDLVFLDIQMPQMDGLQLARALGERMPAVVFVTAYDEYALRAFEVHALDYVLKPFSAERFKSALTHARQHLTKRQSAGARDAAFERRDRLVIKSSGRIYFVRTHEIDWCEAAGNYVRLHVGPQTHLVRGTMGYIESQLDPTQFVRVHRSTIVNVDRIQELRSSFNGEYIITLHDKTRLTLSRGYRDGLQTKLGKAL